MDTVLDQLPELAEDLDVMASIGLTVEQWDALSDTERGLWVDRWQRQQVHRCGHPRHVCADPERQWFPQLEVCHVTREQQAAQAAYERLHTDRQWHNGDMTSWAEKPDDEHPYRYDHGVTIWAAEVDHGHGGAFTTQENPWESLEG